MERLAQVDLEHGERPLADVLDEVLRRAADPLGGVFFDRAPHDVASMGGVALAVRVARRAGFRRVVLNPGVPVDAGYRSLGVEICTFDGDWDAYQRWSGEGSEPGDGHLVYGVPPAQFDAAHRLLDVRSAGFGVVSAGSRG